MGKQRFRAALAVMLALSMSALLLSACGGPSPSSSSTASAGSSASLSSGTGSNDTENALDPDSILLFDGNESSAHLVADMKDGKVPQECNVLYDTMGARPDVTVTDPETITQIYHALSNVIVIGPSTYSITDSYHHVNFKLQDGTSVSYAFEGAGTLVRGKENYAVVGDGPLWMLVRQIQDASMGAKSREVAYPISIVKGEELVQSCPAEALAGEVVLIHVSSSAGAQSVVTVNGSADAVQCLKPSYYVFLMPSQPVKVSIEAGSST